MSCSNLIQPLVFGMLQRCLQFVSVSSFQEKIILHTFDVVVFVGGNGGGWRGKRLDAGLTQYYKNIRNWAIKM